MTLPTFRADDDPGPSFLEVLKRAGGEQRWADVPRELTPHEITHGTTVVAIRYADGVVMAGDRRATSGNLISHRSMEKVFPADRHSGFAIAGASRPAVEMVKLFRLQLEHYEKVEGGELSLEGKANQLAQMVRSHGQSPRHRGPPPPPRSLPGGAPPPRGGVHPPRRRRRRRPVPGARRPTVHPRQHDQRGDQPDRGQDPDQEGVEAMSMPFYVAPEQWMKDKADFARKGIARGKALAALLFADGILICAENSSSTLRKVSEIYDRIAFAGAGKYNEYDRLRIAGVRHADLKGYSFSREDVDAQSLANAYAQMLGDVFTHEVKPMEVEIVVAEVGAGPEGDRLFHILYDGTVVDEEGFTVLGGEADTIGERLQQTYQGGLPLDAALQAAANALAGPGRTLTSAELEVAVLTRGNGG